MRYQTVRVRKNSEIPHEWQHEKADACPGDLVELFNAASDQPHYDANTSVWNRVLEILSLPLCYQPAIAKVLLENRWRSAANPRAYVATASRTQAVRMQLLAEKIPKAAGVDMSNYSKFLRTEIGTEPDSEEDRRQNFIHHTCPHAGEEYEIPHWLQKKHEYDAINWKTVAKNAVLKPAMEKCLARVLEMRFTNGLSRDRAVATAACLDEKREIEAAWKWIDRNARERIGPLFRLDTRPTKANTKRVTEGRSRFLPPGEAIKRVCQREKNAVSVWSLPSIMVAVGKFPKNSLNVDPTVGGPGSPSKRSTL
jgi:hypothetical protein